MITGTLYDSDAPVHTIRNDFFFFKWEKPLFVQKEDRNEKKKFFFYINRDAVIYSSGSFFLKKMAAP